MPYELLMVFVTITAVESPVSLELSTGKHTAATHHLITGLVLPPLPSADECTWECEYCDEDEELHVIAETGSPEAEHTAFHWEQCVAEGSCDDHLCEQPNQEEEDQQDQQDQEPQVGPNLSLSEQIRNVVSVLPHTASDELAKFVNQNRHRVVVNRSRRAVQILGCSDMVVAQIPVSTSDIALIVSLEGAPPARR